MSNFGTDMKDLIISEISSTFPKTKDRLSIWAETDKYIWKEDESVYNQKKGKTAPQYEASFDGEFVCFIDSSKGKRYNLVEFLTNLKKLYVDGKIHVNPQMYDVLEAERKAREEKQKLVVPKAENEAESLIVESIKRSAKKRGRKVVEK